MEIKNVFYHYGKKSLDKCPLCNYSCPFTENSLSEVPSLLYCNNINTIALSLPQSQDLPEVVGLCRSKDRIIWLSILFVYKGVLLVIGVFLAFETRNVKIRELNDSKLISMSVYGILVLSITLAAVGLLLETHVDTFYAVIGFMVMLGNTSLLCLIFIPKV